MLEAAGLSPAGGCCNGPASQHSPVLGSCLCPCCRFLAVLPQKTHQALSASLGWVRGVPVCAGGSVPGVLSAGRGSEPGDTSPGHLQSTSKMLPAWGIRGRCLGSAGAEGSMGWVQTGTFRAAWGQRGSDPARPIEPAMLCASQVISRRLYGPIWKSTFGHYRNINIGSPVVLEQLLRQEGKYPMRSDMALWKEHRDTRRLPYGPFTE